MEEPRLNRISIVLDELNLDQLDLAIILDVSKDTVSRWCRNVNQPKLSDIYRMAKFFRIDMRRLIEPTDWKDAVGNSLLEDYLAKKKSNKIAGNKNINGSRNLKNKKS